MAISDVLQLNKEWSFLEWVISFLVKNIIRMIQFDYSYPLGEKKAKDSELMVFFDKESL